MTIGHKLPGTETMTRSDERHLRPKLSLGQLQALEAVIRTGSFSTAARELNISQPSVSNLVLALEKRFKTRLVARSGHTASATPALEELLPRIRAMLALGRELEKELADQANARQGELRIGYSTHQLAMGHISRFMTRYPQLKLEARAAASHDLMSLLESGQIDIAFISARELPRHLSGRELVKTRIVLAAPKDHPLRTKTPLSWKDLAGLPLIQRESSSGSRRQFEAAATLAGVRLKTVLALGSWGSIASMIRDGIGLGVAMEAEISERDGFSALTIDDPNLVIGHYAVCLQEMARIAAVEAFFDNIGPADRSAARP